MRKGALRPQLRDAARATAWLAALALCACAAHAPAAPGRGAARIASDVAWLAHPDREGRGLGSAGLAQSAEALGTAFQRAGLTPAGAGGAFARPFDAPRGVRVEEAVLEVAGVRLRRGSDFEALPASASGAVSGPLVFVGHGLSDPAGAWDDYAGVDVAGRTVLLLSGPLPDAVAEIAPQRLRAFGRATYQVVNARRHGAAAVLLAPAGSDVPDPRHGTVTADAEGGGVAFTLSRAAAGRIVAAASDTTLERLQEAIAAGRGPASRPLDAGVQGLVRQRRMRTQAANVVALRRGADPSRTHQAVVIGAHYDHLGRGDSGSMAPERRGQVHPGADDNASGTAALVAVARDLGGAPASARTAVLAAFSAEESGLLGAAAYVRDPPVPLERTVAMLNLDMVGRLSTGGLQVHGADTGSGLRERVATAARAEGIEVSFQDGAAPSDHTVFEGAGIPVLLFTTGVHPDYHTPDDRAERVDAAGVARVARLVLRVARELLETEEAPRFVAPEARPARSASGPPRGYGPSLGTIPAFDTEPGAGVRLAGVRPGSAAARAELREGDVIVGFAGAPVTGLGELAALLATELPGRAVDVEVLRDGRRLTLRAVLEGRP